MSELAFTALAALVLFAVVVPALTVASKAALLWSRRREGGLPGGSTAVYLLIIGPVLAPAIWFVSAALHQSEPGSAGDLTDVRHLAGQACYNALTLAAFVASLLVLAFLRRHLAQHRRRARHGGSERCARQARRLDRLCARQPVLARLRRRIVVVEGPTEPLATAGVFRPHITIAADLAAALDDRALNGALLHEAEHLQAHDPLRYLLGSVCLSLNPVAHLLRAELRRWILAREIACDRAAVERGAEPLPLAEAIVVAARQSSPARAWAATALAGAEVRVVRLRVSLLLAYATAGGLLRRRRAPLIASAAILLAVTVLLPHLLDAWPLDDLHPAIDAALASAGLG